MFERVVEAAETVLDFDLAIADAVEDGVLVPKAVAADVGEEGYYETTRLDAEDNLAARAGRTGEPSLVEDLQASDVVPASETYRSALTVPIGDHGVFQAVAEAPGVFDDADLDHTELLVAHANETLERLDREAQIAARTEELAGQHDVESDRVIEADETRLYHLLENLFTNAVEQGSTSDDAVEHGSTGQPTPAADASMDGGAAVTVTVGDLDGGFYVEDDGAGIPSEDRDRAFRRSYSPRQSGTGVGLSLVQQVAEAHGWTVAVTESDAGGVRFEFTGVTVLEDLGRGSTDIP